MERGPFPVNGDFAEPATHGIEMNIAGEVAKIVLIVYNETFEVINKEGAFPGKYRNV